MSKFLTGLFLGFVLGGLAVVANHDKEIDQRQKSDLDALRKSIDQRFQEMESTTH